MTSICFISPPSPFLINDKVIPPLGILYLAAITRQMGVETTVFDCAGNPGWEQKLKHLKADYYGVTATTPQYYYACRIAQILKRSHPRSPIILGGPHLSCGNEFDERLFDILVLGEGEETIREILDRKMRKGYFGMGLLLNGLDRYPFPARDLIDIQNYRYTLDGIPATSMITSRGCPYSCAFCCSVNHASKVRFHSADYVINEIKDIARLGFKGIQFYDDIFILKKDRLFEVCDFLKKEMFKFRCFVRANLVTAEIIQKLKDSGCVEIGFGAESGSDKILRNVAKEATVSQNKEVIRLCHLFGLRAKAFIIVGLPGESRETLKETEQFLSESKPDDVDISILSVMKGSDIARNHTGYDIKFDALDSFYKGIPRRYEGHVWTKGLKREEILQARDYLEERFKRKELLR